MEVRQFYLKIAHASSTSRKNLQLESAGDEDEEVLPENHTRQPLNFQQDLQPQAEYDEGRAVMNNSVGLSEVKSETILESKRQLAIFWTNDDN